MLESTPVLILAGGLGTRLRAALSGQPKGLAPVGSTPFLQLQIELLRDQGARHFVLCVGHLAEQIRATFGDGTRLGVRLSYSVEGEKLLGTGGALKLAEGFFSPRALVLNGDTYYAVDYNRLLHHHRVEAERSHALATLSLAKAPDSSRFGTVLLDPTGRYLAGFQEKTGSAGTGHWLNAGAYVIERTLLERLPPDVVLSLECDVLPGVLKEGGHIAAYAGPEAFYDIGTPQDLEKFVEHYQSLAGRKKAA